MPQKESIRSTLSFWAAGLAMAHPPRLSEFWDGYSDDPLILRNRMTAISLPATRCTWS